MHYTISENEARSYPPYVIKRYLFQRYTTINMAFQVEFTVYRLNING